MEDVQVKFRENESKYSTRDILVQIFDGDSESDGSERAGISTGGPAGDDGEEVAVDGGRALSFFPFISDIFKIYKCFFRA